MVTLGLSITLLGFAALLLWSVNQACSEWRFFSLVAWIGRYSYFNLSVELGYQKQVARPREYLARAFAPDLYRIVDRCWLADGLSG